MRVYVTYILTWYPKNGKIVNAHAIYLKDLGRQELAIPLRHMIVVKVTQSPLLFTFL